MPHQLQDNESSNEWRPLDPPARSGCCSKLGRCGKCCIGCCICSVIVAAVMIPVLILVVAPKVVQQILDQTVISLPNTTMSACDTLHAWVENTAKLNVPGPLIGSATIHSYTQEIWTTVCGDPPYTGGWSCDNATEAMIGHYVAPEMSISQGENTKNFSVRMDLASSTIVLNGLVVPTFIGNHKAVLILKSNDVSISAMGLTFSGLKMHNEVTCSKRAILPAENIPNWVCYPDDPTHEPYSQGGFFLDCTAGLQANLTLASTVTV